MIDQPTRALIFALDISKSNTGLTILSAPFHGQGGIITVLDQIDIKPSEIAKGSQRIWWPTVLCQYNTLRDHIHNYRVSFADHWACLVYEAPAWGLNTSEMMVYLQQRLFEYCDSDPITNLDLFGFTSHFSRAVTRQLYGVPHVQAPKILARAIYDKAIEEDKKGKPDIAQSMQVKVSPDIKDAFCLGVAAAFSTIQFIKMQQINGEYVAHYSASQELFDLSSKQVPNPANRLHVGHYKEFIKSMAKRTEPHLSLKNPYIMPVRSLRLQQGVTFKPLKPSPYPGYLTATEGGLGKVGNTLYPTLVHDHGA